MLTTRSTDKSTGSHAPKVQRSSEGKTIAIRAPGHNALPSTERGCVACLTTWIVTWVVIRKEPRTTSGRPGTFAQKMEMEMLG